MNKRECGSGGIAKLCICLSIMLLLLSSSPENSFVSALPAGESSFVVVLLFNLVDKLNSSIVFIQKTNPFLELERPFKTF